MPRPKKEDAERVMRKNKESALAIIKAISDGQTMRGACRQENVAPSTFNKWVDHFDLSEQYARALQISAELEFDKLDLLASACEAGKINPQAAHVAADIRKWRLARRRPERFGGWVDKANCDSSAALDVLPLYPEGKGKNA